MACRLDGAKPLSEPMLEYCYLDPLEQTSVKSQSKFIYFHSRKCIGKYRQQIGSHLVPASQYTHHTSPQWPSYGASLVIAVEKNDHAMMRLGAHVTNDFSIVIQIPWWRHQMDTFSALQYLCGQFTGPRWIPLTKASDAEFWCALWSKSQRFSKQMWGWRFETPSRSLWRQCNADGSFILLSRKL